MLEKMLLPTKMLSLYLTRIGGVMIVLSAFLVTFEIIFRKFFNQSIGGADEISGYAFGVATALSFAQALFDRAHIRVDAIYHLLPRPLKIVVNFLGLALLIGFASIATFMIWQMVGDSLKHGSRSITPMRVPLVIPQIPWLIGWIFSYFQDF